MSRIANVIWLTISAIIILIAGIAAYLSFALPNVGPSSTINIKGTPARVARGKYLANNVTGCMVCHSKRDWNKYAGPIISGTLGEGGEIFDIKTDFPGTLYSRNITPYGIHNWSDGELLRAFTEGETKDGKSIFPLMPYRAYAKMTTEDAYSIIAYLRTLPSIKNEVPERLLDFPLNIIVNLIPAKAVLIQTLDTGNKVAYGKYLVTISNCIECHSKMGTNKIIEGSEFGGGWPFKMANGTINYAANITPDIETGIGNWSKLNFIKLFKNFQDSSFRTTREVEKDFNTPMPWTAFAGINEDDLGAMYDYLKTIKPIKNKVQRFVKAKTQ